MDTSTFAGLAIFAALVYGVYKLVEYRTRKKTEKSGAAGGGAGGRDTTRREK